MSRSPGCTCPRTRRAWDPVTGVCGRCGNRIRETQIMDAVRAVLITDPRCILWRNEVGRVLSDRFVDGKPRAKPLYLDYGVCSPGGSDLLGCYGPRILAVECKTVRGSQSDEQVDFERWITMRGGIYVLINSEPAASELLVWLRGGGASIPERFRGAGHTPYDSTTQRSH